MDSLSGLRQLFLRIGGPIEAQASARRQNLTNLKKDTKEKNCQSSFNLVAP